MIIIDANAEILKETAMACLKVFYPAFTCNQ
jgi:hypothetical protein